MSLVENECITNLPGLNDRLRYLDRSEEEEEEESDDLEILNNDFESLFVVDERASPSDIMRPSPTIPEVENSRPIYPHLTISQVDIRISNNSSKENLASQIEADWEKIYKDDETFFVAEMLLSQDRQPLGTCTRSNPHRSTTPSTEKLKITTQVLTKPSLLDCDAETDLVLPSLRYHFNTNFETRRKHRHFPRPLKFVYESPQALYGISTQPPEPIIPIAATAANAGKLAKEGKDSTTMPLAKKEKAQKKDKKGKKDKKKEVPLSPPTVPPSVEQPKEIQPPKLDLPIWQPENKVSLVFRSKKAWLIEKKRRKHWFRLESILSNSKKNLKEPERTPKWSNTGERFQRVYNLRAVVKDPRTLELFFKQRKKRHVITAIRIFLLFAEQSTRMKLKILTIPDLIKRLLSLMYFHGGLVRRLAVMLLASLSEAKIFLRIFDDSDGMKKLRWLFEVQYESYLNVWLSLLIRNISQNAGIQKQLINLNYLDPLLDKVSAKEQEPDVVKYLLQTFLFISANDRLRKLLVIRGGLTAVVDLMFSQYKYVQYLTLCLLYKLLWTPFTNAAFRFDRCGGLQLLLDFVTDITQRKLFPLAINILQYILLIPAIASKANDSGLYRTLVETITNKPYENVETLQAFTLKMLCKAAIKEDERRTMHSLGYEHVVLSCLKSNSVDVQINALKTLAMMSQRKTNQNAFYDLGAHRVVLFVMQDADQGVREWAYHAIAYLIFHNKKIANSFIQKNFVAYLVQTLTDESGFETKDTKANALLCAILLRKNSEVRGKLQVPISRMIPCWLIDEKKRIRIYAAVSLSLFVRDAETRAVFAENKGYRAIYLSSMMDNMDVEQQRSLCFGIAVLAVDENVAWSMINAGSIMPLFLKNESDRISQGYVGFALHRLTALERLLKYAFTRHLSEDEKLPHGLHDQGPLSPSNQLCRIEVLLKQALSPHRTIVYISLPKKYWRRPRTLDCCILRAQQEGINFTCTHETICSGSANVPIGMKRIISTLPPQEIFRQNPYNPETPLDDILKGLLKQARHKTKKSKTAQDRVAVLAEMVASRMGGPFDRSGCTDDVVDIGLSFLRKKVNSNCVPLGAIVKGNSLHRALLFKVMADISDLKVSLTSTDAKKAWIGIKLDGEEYIVDLMHNIGRLLPKTSPLAQHYMSPLSSLPEANGTVSRHNYYGGDVRPLRGLYSASRLYLLESFQPPRFESKSRKKCRTGMEKVRLPASFRKRNGKSGAQFQQSFLRKLCNFVQILNQKRKNNNILAREN